RIDRIVSYADPSVPRYNIHVIPDNINWGTPTRPGQPMSAEECVSCIDEQPLVLWIVGSARFLQLEPTANKHSIGILPLCTRHFAIATNLQFNKSQPPRHADARNVLIFANKFNNSRKPFPEAYDATQHLYTWAKMQHRKIDAATIRFNDTVLVECYIKRYRPPDTAFTPDNHWPRWISSFELLRIAVLVKAAAQIPLPKDSDVDL
ncbi:hypothetical protein LXA43DRAFT_886797, partial [Ganoderma leucocontextum]